jgi:lactase-phlorizin hydrolase
MTLNEPWVQAMEGYGIAEHAPQIAGSGTNDYIAEHNLIKSHARAWHIYNDDFRVSQQGM